MRARLEDLPPTGARAPLSRVIGWVVDKIIETATHRRYGTLLIKFAAGKPVQVSFEERWRVDELTAASEAALGETLTDEQIRRLERARDS